MPIGTFTRKIQCHEKSPVSTPPSRTPTAPPPDITKPKTPIALARSPGSVNRPMISASATAETRRRRAPGPRGRRRATSRRRRQAAGDRGDGEGDDAAEEDPLVAEQVAEPAGQQQEAAEGQQVGVDHPGQRGLGEAEVGADRGQRDVHDALVEHDHQVAQAQHVERQPAAPRRGGRRRGACGEGWAVVIVVLLVWKGSVTSPRTGVDEYDRPRATFLTHRSSRATWYRVSRHVVARARGGCSCCSRVGVAGGYAVADRTADEPGDAADALEPVPAVSPRPDAAGRRRAARPGHPAARAGPPHRAESGCAPTGSAARRARRPVPIGWRQNRLADTDIWTFVEPGNPVNTYATARRASSSGAHRVGRRRQGRAGSRRCEDAVANGDLEDFAVDEPDRRHLRCHLRRPTATCG